MLRSDRRQVNPLPALRHAAAGVLVALGAAMLPGAAAAQAPAAQTHTVKSGDTLWDLAKLYLGDSFLWSDLYRLNTAVVEDPHWIYPGEVLRLAGGQDVASVPATDTPAPVQDSLPAAAAEPAAAPAAAADPVPAAYAANAIPAEPAPDEPTVYNFATRRQAQPADSLRPVEPAPPVYAVTAGDFRTASYLADGRDDSVGRLLGPVMPRQIGAGVTAQTMLLGASLVVRPPRGATYQVGDSLLVYEEGKPLHPYGRVVLPTGVVVVAEQAAPDRYVGRLARMFGAVRDGQFVTPLAPFTPTETVAVPGGDVVGQVIGWPEFQRLKSTHDQVFIDRGSQDGVRIGDVFELRRRVDDAEGVLVPITVASARVVHVGVRSATLKIYHITGPDIPVGSAAVQVARMP